MIIFHKAFVSVAKGDFTSNTTRALEICNELLDINPFVEDILDIRASLYEFKTDTSGVKRNRERLKDLQRVRFRFREDEFKE